MIAFKWTPYKSMTASFVNNVPRGFWCKRVVLMVVCFFFFLSLYGFYVTVKYNTSSYRQDRGSILLAWLIYVCFKDTFLNRVLGKKKKYHVACFIYLLDIQRLPACFLRLLHWYHSLYFYRFCFFFFLSILFMSFSNSVFCTLHLYKGMCNIMIRTLQWLV